MTFSVFPIDRSPGYIIHCTDMRMKAGLARSLKKNGFDITPEQWGVLSRLWEIEGLNQRALSEKVDKDRANITRILNILEKNHLIRRLPDPNDKRSQRIHLTKAGRALQEKITPIVNNFLEECFKGMSQQKIDTFLSVHRQIYKNLKTL